MVDVKISALPVASAITDDDLLLVVNDPLGVPETRQITALNARVYLKGDTGLTGSTGATGGAGAAGTNGTNGAAGAAATVAVGTTTTGTAAVTNSGTSSAAVFNFTVPQGTAGTNGTNGTNGAAATVAVGTTTTGAAAVTNSGTTSAAVFNFTVPQGVAGTNGTNGTNGSGVPVGGATGQVLKKTTATDFDVSWLTLGTAATTASTAYATAAQGTTADGAVPKSLTTAKGALTAGSGVSTPATLTVGTDGQVLTADAASGAGVKWSTLPLQVTFTSSSQANTAVTTMVSVTNMSFAVVSGSRYWFRFMQPYNQSATTNGSRWWVTGPATTSLNAVSRWTSSATAQSVFYGALIGTPPSATTTGLTVGSFAVVEGMYVPSASGTVSLQFASSVATAATVTCLAGGFVEWRLLA